MDVYVIKNEPSLTYDDVIERTVDFRAAAGVWVNDPGTAVW